MRIAIDLGVTRKKVRKARERLGIESQGVGRRRGTAAAPTLQAVQSPVDGLTAAERNLIDRYRADRRTAPSEAVLVTRLHAAHDAKTAGDTLAYEAAMFGVAMAAARIAEHSQKLRRAA